MFREIFILALLPSAVFRLSVQTPLHSWSRTTNYVETYCFLFKHFCSQQKQKLCVCFIPKSGNIYLNRSRICFCSDANLFEYIPMGLPNLQHIFNEKSMEGFVYFKFVLRSCRQYCDTSGSVFDCYCELINIANNFLCTCRVSEGHFGTEVCHW